MIRSLSEASDTARSWRGTSACEAAAHPALHTALDTYRRFALHEDIERHMNDPYAVGA